MVLGPRFAAVQIDQDRRQLVERQPLAGRVRLERAFRFGLSFLGDSQGVASAVAYERLDVGRDLGDRRVAIRRFGWRDLRQDRRGESFVGALAFVGAISALRESPPLSAQVRGFRTR